MRYLTLFGLVLFMLSCKDNAFMPVDNLSPRQYSTSANVNSEVADDAVEGYLGLWAGVLSSVDEDAPQNIQVKNNGTATSVSIDFGNGVTHTARVHGDFAFLPLTGTSWKNAVEKCPPTADLFVTLKFKLVNDAENTLEIVNSLKTEATMHADVFVLK